MNLRTYLCFTLTLAVSGCGWLIGIGDRSVDAGRDSGHDADAPGADAPSDVPMDLPLEVPPNVDGPAPADARADKAEADATGAGGGAGSAGTGGTGGVGGAGGAAGAKMPPADGGPTDGPTDATPDASIVIVGPTEGRTSLIHIVAASNHSCATKSDQTITCWGAPVGTPPAGPFAQLATGRDFTCGLTSTMGGTVSCSGVTNDAGQLNAPNGGAFVQLTAGYAHACARQLTGATVCWGDNQYGQRSPPSAFYSDVSAGGNRRCLVDFDGHVECVGEKIVGTDQRAGPYSSVSVGPTVSCGISSAGGALDCWDFAGDRLGPLGGAFTHVAVGGDQVCGVTKATELKCWGLTGAPRADTPSGLFWEVAVGANHACALRKTNFAVCWGNNANLQATPP